MLRKPGFAGRFNHQGIGSVTPAYAYDYYAQLSTPLSSADRTLVDSFFAETVSVFPKLDYLHIPGFFTSATDAHLNLVPAPELNTRTIDTFAGGTGSSITSTFLGLDTDGGALFNISGTASSTVTGLTICSISASPTVNTGETITSTVDIMLVSGTAVSVTHQLDERSGSLIGNVNTFLTTSLNNNPGQYITSTLSRTCTGANGNTVNNGIRLQSLSTGASVNFTLKVRRSSLKRMRHIRQVNGPTFTSKKGFVGGGTAYITPEVNPAVTTSKLLKTDMCFGAFTTGTAVVASSFAGFYQSTTPIGGTTLRITNSPNQVQTRANCNAGIPSINFTGANTLYLAANRTGSAAQQLYHNGVLLSSNTEANMSSPPDGHLRYGSINDTSFNNLTCGVTFGGAGMTESEHMILFQACNKLMTLGGSI